MTERHYFNNDDLRMQAQVTRCTAEPDGSFRVILSATLFHPQGGGQPSDLGMIAGANVIRVMQDGDEIVHLVDRPVPEGAALIDVHAASRHLHARLHSAGHLIGTCGEQAGWRPVKGHHWPGECRVVFEGDAGQQALDAVTLEQQVNALVEADLPRFLVQDDGQRAVGFGHLPAYGCGGTHVVSSGAIGKIRIVKIKEKKGQLSVHYDIDRA